MTERIMIAAGVGAIAAGFGLAAWVLRYEFRAQMRARRRSGYLIGGQQ